MEGKRFSKAREEWIRKEEQAHEAVLAMLKKFDERSPSARTPASALRTPMAPLDEEPIFEEENSITPVRRRVGLDTKRTTIRRTRRMGKFVEHLPSEEEVEQMEEDASEENPAEWRLSTVGPKVVSYQPAPWEEREVSQPSPPATELEDPQKLEDIIEDEEDCLSSSSHCVGSTSTKPNIAAPSAEFGYRSSSGGYSSIHSISSDACPCPSTPRSPNAPLSPVSEPTVPKTPPKSPSSLRTRASLKKIFLSTLRPRKRDDNEPLSPSTTLSSAATTPSLPTPTIRITSPFHPRRLDGSPLDDHPMMANLSPIETSFKLPELRLSRADWSEWGRQVAYNDVSE
jgi:hypothetical protein